MASNKPQHPERTSQNTPLREEIIKVATEHLHVREKKSPNGAYGLNDDDAGNIKKFFLEGVMWTEAQWKAQFNKDSSEPGSGPAWCAAFASYCVLQGHGRAGIPLATPRHASGPELKKLLMNAGLWIPMDSLYDSAGHPKATGRIPAPGDFVIYGTGHTGLVKEFRHAERVLETIEGNSWTGTVRDDGVWELKKANGRGFDKIAGFGITDPVECTSSTCGWQGSLH